MGSLLNQYAMNVPFKVQRIHALLSILIGPVISYSYTGDPHRCKASVRRHKVGVRQVCRRMPNIENRFLHQFAIEYNAGNPHG